MAEFARIDCPHCGAKRIFEVLVGVARGQCWRCHRRIMAGKHPDGHVEVMAVDKRLRLRKNHSEVIAHPA